MLVFQVLTAWKGDALLAQQRPQALVGDVVDPPLGDQEVGQHPAQRDPGTGRARPDPEPERPWREDPRLLRAYGWLTVLVAAAGAVTAPAARPAATTRAESAAARRWG